MQMTARDAVAFLWQGQDGYFEIAQRVSRRIVLERDEALTRLDGMNFFAPLARKTIGSTKKDVADQGNVLWADLDSLDGKERISKRLPVTPSLVVFSGKKGYWTYFKHARCLQAKTCCYTGLTAQLKRRDVLCTD